MWIYPMGGQTPFPSASLYSTQVYQPLKGSAGLCPTRVSAAGGGNPATAPVNIPGPSPAAETLVSIGPGPLLAATGGHYT